MSYTSHCAEHINFMCTCIYLSFVIHVIKNSIKGQSFLPRFIRPNLIADMGQAPICNWLLIRVQF